MKEQSHRRGTGRSIRTPPIRAFMARGLGWFRSGLGLAEVLAPRALTRSLGMEGNEQLVQAMASAELATGIRFSRRTSLRLGYGGVSEVMGSIWPRSQRTAADNPKKDNVELALAAIAGVTALDVVCGTLLARHARRSHAGV